MAVAQDGPVERGKGFYFKVYSISLHGCVLQIQHYEKRYRLFSSLMFPISWSSHSCVVALHCLCSCPFLSTGAGHTFLTNARYDSVTRKGLSLSIIMNSYGESTSNILVLTSQLD